MKRLAIVLLPLAIAAPALAQDATGSWQLTVTTTQRPDPRTTSMALKKEGDKLSGTIVGPDSVELKVTGTQTGADLSIGFTVQTQNGPLQVAMKGRQDGESMKGTLEVAGAAEKGDWTAVRKGNSPPAAASGSDMTGTWAIAVTTDAGSGSPVATIQQDGESLSGRYKGLFGEAPLTGKVRGREFSFEATLNIEGNTVTLTYTGTVEGDAISGKVTFGDFGGGTFAGKRQPGGK